MFVDIDIGDHKPKRGEEFDNSNKYVALDFSPDSISYSASNPGSMHIQASIQQGNISQKYHFIYNFF